MKKMLVLGVGKSMSTENADTNDLKSQSYAIYIKNIDDMNHMVSKLFVNLIKKF